MERLYLHRQQPSQLQQRHRYRWQRQHLALHAEQRHSARSLPSLRCSSSGISIPVIRISPSTTYIPYSLPMARNFWLGLTIHTAIALHNRKTGKTLFNQEIPGLCRHPVKSLHHKYLGYCQEKQWRNLVCPQQLWHHRQASG